MMGTIHYVNDLRNATGWLGSAKWAFSTRRVQRDDAHFASADAMANARPGDLLLARIEQIGQHKRVQLAEGRHSDLYPGDLIVLTCGARYAPDQFEGQPELDERLVDMLASGGVAGRMRERHQKTSQPTKLAPIGLLLDADGRVLNIQKYALPERACDGGLCTIVVVGASMNSGKTVATASLAHGLARAGHRVAAIKGTGTGAFGDFHSFVDAGAHFVADFTDAGMASTYQEPLERIEAGVRTLLAAAAAEDCSVAVVELADGVLQQEAAALLRHPGFRDLFDSVLLATPDALAAYGGQKVLHDMGLPVCGLTGTVTMSPLSSREAAQYTGLPVFRRDDLCDPARANSLLNTLLERRPHERLKATA